MSESNPNDHSGFPEDDYSGLAAWIDDHGRFYAVGADGIAREYGDGPQEAGRLHRDAQGDVLPALRRMAQGIDPTPFRPSRPERAAIIAALALASWLLFGIVAALIAGRL